MPEYNGGMYDARIKTDGERAIEEIKEILSAHLPAIAEVIER